ncbi:aftiphilin-like isoform X1 [Solea solea]|uniref:aftiphilin-like isoform X1 n=1 Tax=Solea solea TaxID=90069 RepID=UPI00272CF896|nr:aftiphilin-like isoform X1 [Solea solea]
MEPYIMPLHSSSPPPLDDDGDGEAGSDDDEFGDFGVFSCSPPGFPSSIKPPPSSLKEPAPAIKAAKDPPTCNLNHPDEQFQTLSSLGSNSVRGEGFDAELSSHLTNGYGEGGHNSEAHDAPVVGTFSYMEESGFADFTVFSDQAAHPWCCGFSPLGNPEKWVGKVEGSNMGEQIYGPAEVIMNSEPKSLCVHEARENICTKVNHCENRDAAIVHSSQDHQQHQEAVAAFESEQPCFAEEDTGNDGDSWREIRCRLGSLQTSELHEDEESEKPPTVSVYESAFEDLSSICEDFSFEGISSDLEPNVSSLASPDNQSDWDHTDDEDEELENPKRSDSFGNSSMTNLSQIEEDKCFHQSVTQETSATSTQSHSLTCRGDEFADFSDSVWEHHKDQECVQDVNVMVQSLGTLPPSDSFADFCSAPTQEDGDGSWAVFQDKRDQEEGQMRTQVRDQVSSLHIDGCTEEDGGLKRNSCQVLFSCRVQQLLWTTFPEVVVPAMEGEEEAQSLGALLLSRHLTESEEEKMPELSSDQWVQQGLCWPHKDIHSAVGLRFQWRGSHTNMTLLRCLGVDTRNNVFIGAKKSVAVSTFASNLGKLDPTKDSAPAACSTANTAGTPQEFPGPHVKLDPSKDSVQEAPPSGLLERSSRRLSSSQDDSFALNLDYFGPEEKSRSNICSNSPPPGVDRELYELTMSNLETSSSSHHLEDTLNRLMSAAEKTSTAVRKPLQDEELSAESSRVIAGLPNLSFMKATVLMFPSILIPKESLVLE